VDEKVIRTWAPDFVVADRVVADPSAPVRAREVAAYNAAHRGMLLASEIALGLALLAFLVFIAPPALPVAGRTGDRRHRRAGRRVDAATVTSVT
jgi:MFS family permease